VFFYALSHRATRNDLHLAYAPGKHAPAGESNGSMLKMSRLEGGQPNLRSTPRPDLKSVRSVRSSVGECGKWRTSFSFSFSFFWELWKWDLVPQTALIWPWSSSEWRVEILEEIYSFPVHLRTLPRVCFPRSGRERQSDGHAGCGGGSAMRDSSVQK